MVWKPLSSRRSAAADVLRQGVPDDMAPVLWDWLLPHLSRNGGVDVTPIRRLALLARIALPVDAGDFRSYQDLQTRCTSDSDTFLDVLDAALYLDNTGADMLEAYLALGSSFWAVAPDRQSLTERVDPIVHDAAAAAMSPQDAASAELAEAWRAAYSRNPNASDAWDHCIKAVEAALVPVLIPTQDKPHLGHVLGALRTRGEQF